MDIGSIFAIALICCVFIALIALFSRNGRRTPDKRMYRGSDPVDNAYADSGDYTSGDAFRQRHQSGPHHQHSDHQHGHHQSSSQPQHHIGHHQSGSGGWSGSIDSGHSHHSSGGSDFSGGGFHHH